MTRKLKTTEDIKIILLKLPHVLRVRFAYNEVVRVEHLLNKEGKHCLELVKHWLENPTSVSNQQLQDAAYAANAAAYAAYAAAAAANAAHAAANAAAYAAYAAAAAAAANAAHAAANAAANAAYAADYSKRDILIDESYYRLVGMINPLHKVFWELDQSF